MPTIEAVVARATRADGAAPLDEATLMALNEGQAHIIRRDGCFAVVHDGELSLVVDPPTRRYGLGSTLLEQVMHTHPEAVRAWSHCNHPGAAALAKRYGWRRVRDLWVMRRPMGTDAPDLPALEVPDDVAIHRFGEVAGDTDELLRVNRAAFADHPEQGRMDLLNLAARMREPWFDPAGLLMAAPADGGPLLGFHWTKQHSPALGEVYVVGVAPDAQGRGLGKVLTLAGLHHLAEQGVDEVILYVESTNAAAIATYRALGFTHAESDTHVMYVR